MPGMTGLQLLEKVRACGWTVPAVVMSAYGDADTRRTVEQLGATFLDKPIETAALQRIIAGSIGR
jgi:FixJ family two-component response regulator